MRSIALVGEFCSGKTTLAEHLVEHHGYTRISFAKRLKEIAASVYSRGDPVAKDGKYEVSRQYENDTILSGRQILQELGQAVKDLDRDFWIRWLAADLEAGLYGDGPFVTDDARFPFEAEALRRRDFVIVRLDTPAYVRAERHQLLYGRQPSEAELAHPSEVESKKIEVDVTIKGTRTVEVLADVIVNLDAYSRYAA